jgi:hypothetical protein
MTAPARSNALAIAFGLLALHAAFGAWPLFGIHPCAGIVAALLAVALLLLAVALLLLAVARLRHANAYRFQP